MTPTRVKIVKPSTADNYDISDLHSDDDTDNEDEPRKRIPAWALGRFDAQNCLGFGLPLLAVPEAAKQKHVDLDLSVTIKIIQEVEAALRKKMLRPKLELLSQSILILKFLTVISAVVLICIASGWTTIAIPVNVNFD